ncbi:MAG TPA: MerR family transcriptional regulator [Kofleriaceae bacterium]|nr:MerR family transcriptional regulator [Kofleriaceae bacterium]
MHTVGEVARIARVSIRTLHHYDEIGLLRPSGRSRAGYRLYSSGDLERLQQILFFRELGFALEDIVRILREPDVDRGQALLAQRALVVDKIARLQAMLALIDRTIASLEGGITMTPEDMFDVFGDFDPNQHEDEVRERWGDTDAYKESKRRTSKYTKEDWKRMGAEMEEITAALAAALTAGTPPDDPSVLDLAERHRLHIDRWFYPCSHQMHEGLGEMYVSDPRFTDHYDQRVPGLAAFVRDAIRGNAARQR